MRVCVYLCIYCMLSYETKYKITNKNHAVKCKHAVNIATKSCNETKQSLNKIANAKYDFKIFAFS